MTSRIPYLLTFLLLLLLSSASSLHRFQPSNSPAPGSFSEEQTRVGSIPPSCHNRCNGCHPCMAVQVPTSPTSHPCMAVQVPTSPTSHPCMAVQVPTSPTSHHHRFKPALFHPSSNQYSNYKPLGWKCSCADHFYNP